MIAERPSLPGGIAALLAVVLLSLGLPAFSDRGQAEGDGSTLASTQTQAIAQHGSLEARLLSAINHGDLKQVRQLIDAGADANTQREIRADGVSEEMLRDMGLRGITPVVLAALNGDPGVVTLLVEAGADIDAMTVQAHDGSQVEFVGTALMAAAREGHFEVTRLLVDRGANVMASWRNENALIAAARTGQVEIAELLVGAGGYRPGSLNGMKALQTAKAEGHEKVAELLQAGLDEYIESGEMLEAFTQGLEARLERIRQGIERAAPQPESPSDTSSGGVD